MRCIRAIHYYYHYYHYYYPAAAVCLKALNKIKVDKHRNGDCAMRTCSQTLGRAFEEDDYDEVAEEEEEQETMGLFELSF